MMQTFPVFQKKSIHLEQYAILFIAFFFLFAICIDSFSAFSRECMALRQDVLRLHVIANSNSANDQQIKLQIRDEILKETGDWFESASGKENAEIKIEENIQIVESVALRKLQELGINQGVSVTIGKSFFDTRVYGDLTMPAGWYDAVRVVIGEGNGKNWWCVLYPPLCLPAAVDRNVFTEAEWALLESPKYEVHFLLYELWEKWKAYFFGK